MIGRPQEKGVSVVAMTKGVGAGVPPFAGTKSESSSLTETRARPEGA
jgi:hypothetical protein